MTIGAQGEGMVAGDIVNTASRLHVIEWARSLPLYVVTLARPDLLEKRPDWGAGTRNFTSVSLDPLDADARVSLCTAWPLRRRRLDLLEAEDVGRTVSVTDERRHLRSIGRCGIAVELRPLGPR